MPADNGHNGPVSRFFVHAGGAAGGIVLSLTGDMDRRVFWALLTPAGGG